MTTEIHPSAHVDPDADIGDDVTIGPNVVIEQDVALGDGCRIGPGAVIHQYTTMGPRCRVHAHAVLGDLPQDLAFEDKKTFLEIGSDSVFREGVTVHRGTKEGSKTTIGNHCFLMAYSHVGHNCEIGNHVILVNNVMLAGYVIVGDNVFFGGGSGIHQFVQIGRLAMIGGNSSVSQDFPPFCTAAPAHLNRLLGLNTVGLRRAGLSPDDRLNLKKALPLIFKSNLNREETAERLKSEFPEGPVHE
ncbi:MAG: acyl-ACP--UDP-N-acetylglucosamine O-acyltransferase, partial [Verrucomicrobiota bacterium]